MTRKTIVKILQGISSDKFYMFRSNPEEFISKVSGLINDEKASIIVDHVTYNKLNQTFDSTIFNEKRTDFDQNKVFASKKAIQDFVFLDGTAKESNERLFAEDLEKDQQVKVFAKLPKGFYIPTPMGNYSPDWAIVYEENNIRNIDFIAETKGSLDSLELRKIEEAKIKCASKLFNGMPNTVVHYGMVNTYEQLLALINNLEPNSPNK